MIPLMDKFFITVRVADREYRLNIDRKEEELVREVVTQINENLNEYAHNYEFKDKQDLLSMVVLHNAIRNKKLESELAFQQGQLSDKLENINIVLTETLST
jgi:cell division protein ZapA (FtsZ GTPase activity inhibitor)